jgi:hypothetical protein
MLYSGILLLNFRFNRSLQPTLPPGQWQVEIIGCMNEGLNEGLPLLIFMKNQ